MDKVTVLRNPTRKELDNYFDDACDKADDYSEEKHGKAGCTLLFHCVGHGAIVNTH